MLQMQCYLGRVPRPITSLRRLSHALLGRTEARLLATDWWAVFVEILVVVLGIIIAFELNEWDQRRQQRKEAEQILRHLSEETAADIAAISTIADQHTESAANYRMLLVAIEDRASAKGYNRSGDADCNLLRMPAVRYHSPGGLEAGERADLIEDLRLRHLIRRADAERAFNDRQLDYFRDAFDRYGDVIEPYMHWQLTRPGSFECSVDIDALTGDPRAVSLLPKVGRDQQRFAEYRQRELAATKLVSARALCLRQQNCGRT
jgi:hypothetical protein